MKKLNYFKNLLQGINGILTIISLGILVNYYWGGKDAGFFGVFQLVTLPILGCHLLCFLYWVFKGSKWALASLFVMGLSYYVFGNFYKGGQDAKSKEGDFTVMSYNAMGFNRFDQINMPHAGDSISAFIIEKSPDIVCLQEHARSRKKQLMQYRYLSETPRNSSRSIQAIFSKYPIIGRGSLNLPESTNNIIFADVAINNDTIRVYNVHLESFKIVPNDTDISSKASEKVYQRIKSTITTQRRQAKLLREHISASPFSALVCGDFNNTQFSRVFRLVSEGMEDSFQVMGNGMGKTYSVKGVPLRIDYILAENRFEFLGHWNYEKKYSDHEPVMARVSLRPNEKTIH
ncbi:MAG: endonuclease/exonuclease/phosphatase family protein [Croceivirga sp.]